MRTLFASLLLLSCGVGVSPELEFEPELEVTVAPTLERRLGADEAPLLLVIPSETGGAIEAREPQHQACYSVVDLSATGGQLMGHLVQAGEGIALELDRFDVQLAEVPLLDTGLWLTRLHFHLAAAEAFPVTWYGNRTEAVARLFVTLTVSGSVRGPSGTVSPFETQTFTGVAVDLSLTLDDQGRVVARFRTETDQKPTWNWADLLETGAAKFHGRAVELVPGPELGPAS